MTTLKLIKFPVPLLNSAVYRDPDGRHTYWIASEKNGRAFLHVAGCPVLSAAGGGDQAVGTYNELCVYTSSSSPMGCTRCQPHGHGHVVMPDGTRRFHPMGPIMSGGTESDYKYAMYALVEQHRGEWRVREWAPSGPAAIERAAKLGITIILGEHNAKLGLPTPIPES